MSAKPQDNFVELFKLITEDLLVIIDHVTVSAPTIRTSNNIYLRSVIKKYFIVETIIGFCKIQAAESNTCSFELVPSQTLYMAI